MSLFQKVEGLIRRKSNLTELQIARELLGPDAYQQKVNKPCRRLVEAKRVERRGKGGPTDPFRYFAKAI